MIRYDSIREMAEEAERCCKSISSLVLEEQAVCLGKPAECLLERMNAHYEVMKESIRSGCAREARSPSGLSGGDACKMLRYAGTGGTLGGEMSGLVMARALAVAEWNASMGRIAAAPTAGSCGILPAVLTAVAERRNASDEAVVMSLFTAAGIGMVIAGRASISGAEGGCQAECGSAAAMAAAAAAELAGGTPGMVAHACAIALKNVLGLVCDPVAGLVEVPCVKRNALGAVHALAAADMALAGIESFIPADEVIDAMKSVGLLMPLSLKETAAGGLAATPTGKKAAEKLSMGR